ncbi:hypothetical protein C8J57DRAFT_1242251 [Mycena rebaudengoi]|nr:hypothetical protein C8J57DRAFT_1242251 [Mycena rebaudengoi]
MKRLFEGVHSPAYRFYATKHTRRYTASNRSIYRLHPGVNVGVIRVYVRTPALASKQTRQDIHQRLKEDWAMGNAPFRGLASTSASTSTATSAPAGKRRSLLSSARAHSSGSSSNNHSNNHTGGTGVRHRGGGRGGTSGASGSGSASASGSGNGNGTGSFVPQKRKLGPGGGGGGARHRGFVGGSAPEGIGVGVGGEGAAEEGEAIRCRCGSGADDGFSIACDACGRWCHAACFGVQKESVPEDWACWATIISVQHTSIISLGPIYEQINAAVPLQPSLQVLCAQFTYAV